MIFIYVIKSREKNFRYVGITNNLDRRIKEHNSKKSKSTAPYCPFDLRLKEEYSDYSEARKREKFLKSGQGRKFLDML
ncbi:GIY-YIG nuclease family protein [Candidatus Nomurabacteria bacterium]|nr:GIY-YIG nuclease family protein [Candidatus Nomurabacteria bacterium]